MTPDQKAKRMETQKAYRSRKKPIELDISEFHNIASEGPVYICFCCNQLWYKKSVLNAKKLKDLNPVIHEYLKEKRRTDTAEWVCKTCHSHLVKNKIPPCAVVNSLVFPQKPTFFDLNELECRLLAPRIAFQKLMQAPRGKQLKTHGNIVNVPADVASTVCMLPRLPSEAATIKVNLKRKLQYKSSALSLNVRPHKVVQAADWLMRNSSLYKDEGIVINSQWANQYNKEIEQEQNLDDACSDQSAENVENSNNSHSERVDDDDYSSESEDIVPAGVTDTMFTSTDF